MLDRATPGPIRKRPSQPAFDRSSAKGWVKFSVAAVISVSHNVTSITDNATGNFDVVWDTDFSSANYSANANVLASSAANRKATVIAQAAGTITVITQAGSADAPDEADITDVLVTVFGDQ